MIIKQKNLFLSIKSFKFMSMNDKKSHLGNAIVELSRKKETTLTHIAEISGIKQNTLSRTVNGIRPEAKTLNALCSPNAHGDDGKDLLIAHLRDEVEIAGRHSAEFIIKRQDKPVSETVRILSAEATADNHLRSLLNDLAAMCLRHPKSELIMAETQAEYGKK